MKLTASDRRIGDRIPFNICREIVTLRRMKRYGCRGRAVPREQRIADLNAELAGLEPPERIRDMLAEARRA
jgi:hypothetical protein